MKNFLIDNVPHICLFSLEDVDIGEEITYDYGGYDLRRHFANQNRVILLSSIMNIISVSMICNVDARLCYLSLSDDIGFMNIHR